MMRVATFQHVVTASRLALINAMGERGRTMVPVGEETEDEQVPKEAERSWGRGWESGDGISNRSLARTRTRRCSLIASAHPCV
jgi:hypothetical protein